MSIEKKILLNSFVLASLMLTTVAHTETITTKKHAPTRLRLDLPQNFSIDVPKDFSANIQLPERFNIHLCTQETACNLAGTAAAIIGLFTIYRGLDKEPTSFTQIFSGLGLCAAAYLILHKTDPIPLLTVPIDNFQHEQAHWPND